MKLHHIALVSSSEERSDRFYAEVLGLEKKQVRKAPASLMKQLFNLEEEATFINYVGDNGLFFEIFVVRFRESVPLSHCCLAVNDRDAFLTTCEKMSVPIRRFVKKDGGSVVFVEDYDHNLFEIKEMT